ncbi:MAG: hypothetical protein NTZ39_01635 [Methanoregula sp.]|nr:hypothetical protein [Methanoregula sp.]
MFACLFRPPVTIILGWYSNKDADHRTSFVYRCDYLPLERSVADQINHEL